MKVEKIPIIIRPILAFIAGLFFYTPILPVEIILKNGDIFIADFVSENESSTTIKWKNDVYIIPKAEVRTIDLKKAGSNKSYRPIEYILLDGSRMKGIFVEQDKDIITLKSELGFLKIDKTKISKIEGVNSLTRMLKKLILILEFMERLIKFLEILYRITTLMLMEVDFT